MPPRTRVRPSQLKPNPGRSIVRLPQELIDAIIDEFDITLKDESDYRAYPDRKTLRSCALVAHTFVRPSQRKLFSTVNLWSGPLIYDSPPDERIRQFSKLLSSKPHIAHYVQNLLLSYRSARSHSVDHILSALPKLKRLCLYAHGDRNRSDCCPLPQPRDAFLQAFSIPSLRCLELRNLKFADASELDSILGNSVGLKELMLRKIQFANDSSRASTPGPSRVVLHCLEVFEVEATHVEALLAAFTAVDVTHLRSISCDGYSISLLQTNTLSLREFTLAIKWRLGYQLEALAQILLASQNLHSINLRIYGTDTICHIIHQLGSLVHLKALKRLSITAYMAYGHSHWSNIDSLLAETGSELEEIRITHIPPIGHPYEMNLRQLMPLLNAKGVLTVSTSPGRSGLELFPFS